jgi:soluble lytic murein transglycosylase-like protein
MTSTIHRALFSTVFLSLLGAAAHAQVDESPAVGIAPDAIATGMSAPSPVRPSIQPAALLIPDARASADTSNPVEMTRLAQRYEHGEGVEKDFAKANQLYCQAAKAGYVEAQFRLGWVYANGRGVPHDDGIAAVLFVMAAEQGHEHARRLLQYVRAQPNTQLPSCLLPDPVVPDVKVAEEESVIEFKGSPEVAALVKQLAPQYAIDPQLVMALISVESGFNAKAVSPKNAQGLMQLIPETAERFGVKKVFNPSENIKGGLAYLRWLMAFFEGEVKLVLAAYNAGEGAVERYKGVPPYEETKNYVQRITSVYKKSNHPYSTGVVAPSAVISALRRAGN